jgi:hypothetical protein
MTWFRKESRLAWIDANEKMTAESIAEMIVERREDVRT